HRPERQRRSACREPGVGGRPMPRMEEPLEPHQLGADREDDLAYATAVTDRIGAPAVADRLADLRIAGEQIMDDRVGGQRRGAVSRERSQRLALARRDASGDRDRRRSPHYWVGGSSASATGAGASAGSSGAGVSSVKTSSERSIAG